MLLKRLVFFFAFLALQSGDLLAESNTTSVVGLWQSVNDQGKPTGYVRISEEGGVLHGVIERGLPTDDEDKRCTACKGQRKNQRMLGMEVLWNLHKDGGEYSGGEILDPFSGNIYQAKLTLQDNGTKLKIRGFLGLSLFGRTQVWLREE